MIYLCNNCGHEFGEPDIRTDYMDYEGRFYPYEMYYVCPRCGSDEIEDIRHNERREIIDEIRKDTMKLAESYGEVDVYAPQFEDIYQDYADDGLTYEEAMEMILKEIVYYVNN